MPKIQNRQEKRKIITEIVVDTLRLMKSSKGVTMNAIGKKVSTLYRPDHAKMIATRLPDVLKKGVAFGAVTRIGRRYKLNPLICPSKKVRQSKRLPDQHPIAQAIQQRIRRVIAAASKNCWNELLE